MSTPAIGSVTPPAGGAEVSLPSPSAVEASTREMGLLALEDGRSAAASSSAKEKGEALLQAVWMKLPEGVSEKTRLEEMQKLYDEGVDLHYQDEAGRDALYTAAEYDDTAIGGWLIDKGVNINSTTRSEMTPLMRAALKGHIRMLKFLLKAGANTSCLNNNHRTALGVAARAGRIDAVKTLIASKTVEEIHAAYGDEGQALVLAADAGHLEVVRALLEAGVDKEARDNNNSTALIAAAYEGHVGVITALLEAGVNKEARDDNNSTALIAAAYEGHAGVIKALLDAGVNTLGVLENKRTALAVAARAGHIDAVKALIASKTLEEIRAAYGVEGIPLVDATCAGSVEVITALLEAGVDKEARDEEGDTALIHAAKKGHLTILEFLLRIGADKDATDKDGDTALSCAVRNDQIEAVRLLLRHGADANKCKEGLRPPLSWAVTDGPKEDCEISVIDQGARVRDMTRLLLDAGADPDAISEGGYSPLLLAAGYGWREAVKELITARTDSHAEKEKIKERLKVTKSVGNYKATPLILAARHNHTGVIEELARAGAEIDATPDNTPTALAQAVSSKKEEAVRMLLSLGANPRVVGYVQGKVLSAVFSAAAQRAKGDGLMAQIIAQALAKRGVSSDSTLPPGAKRSRHD